MVCSRVQLGRGFNAVANVGGNGGGVMDGLFGKNRGLSGGVGRLGKAFGGGGMKGVGTAAGRMIKASAKGNLITSSLMGLGDIGMNLYEGKDVGESLVRALLTTGVGFGGGALGTLVAPGAGTVAGSMAGGMLGQQIGDWVYGDKTQEANVNDAVIKFNPQDKVVSMSDGMVASTNKGKIDDLVGGSRGGSVQKIEFGKLEITGTIQLEIPGSLPKEIDLANEPEFVRKMSTLITQQLRINASGGKLSPNMY
jgi:hypothetical protein